MLVKNVLFTVIDLYNRYVCVLGVWVSGMGLYYPLFQLYITIVLRAKGLLPIIFGTKFPLR